MGFEDEEFISDYNDNKLNKSEISILQNNFYKRPMFGNDYIDGSMADSYMGKFFAVKACNNKDFDYSKGLESLRGINAELFGILDSFINEWYDIDIERQNDIMFDYHSMEYNFFLDIESWILRNNIK